MMMMMMMERLTMQIELEVAIIISNSPLSLVKRDYSWNTYRGYAGICTFKRNTEYMKLHSTKVRNSQPTKINSYKKLVSHSLEVT